MTEPEAHPLRDRFGDPWPAIEITSLTNEKD